MNTSFLHKRYQTSGMWYWIFKWLFAAVFKVCFHLKVYGLENLPRKTNYIIVPNHASTLDPLCIMAALPVKIHCVAARYLYYVPVVGWFLRRAATFPTGSSSEKSIALLNQNKNVGIFPEGACSLDGKLGEFRRGAALMAIRTGRPVVPCAIIGTFEALPWGRWIPRFVPITVRVGKPIYLLKEHEDVIDDVLLREGIFRIRAAVQTMLNGG